MKEKNLQALKDNPYPGRGIVVGLDETGKKLVQVYWIMGRSPNSRNRLFEKDATGRLRTEAADPSKVSDPSLIIYTAMLETEDGLYAVSNGVQTDRIIEQDRGFFHFGGLREATFAFDYEPDAPNFTPRISAICSLRLNPYAEMSIIKKSPRNMDTERHFYSLSKFSNGEGYCITTYDGPGDPLPAFSGIPYELPITGANAEEIAESFWAVLNEENRISLAVKTIPTNLGPSNIHIINKYTQVAQ